LHSVFVILSDSLENLVGSQRKHKLFHGSKVLSMFRGTESESASAMSFDNSATLLAVAESRGTVKSSCHSVVQLFAVTRHNHS